MKENEPEKFARIRKIMLPKDYLAYRLSGTFCSDYSDASGMLLMDVKNKCWSKEMMEICGISREQLPDLYESYEVVGTLKKEEAKKLGLPESVKIIAGAGDNAAAAVGTGTPTTTATRYRPHSVPRVQYFPRNERYHLYFQPEVSGRPV